MDENRKSRSILPYLLLAGTGAVLFARQLTQVVTTQYVIESDRVPSAFDGFRIVQVSDLHNNKFICHEGRLAERVKRLRPDIVVITGDIADDIRPDFDIAVRFVRSVSAFADIFYVPGNHEAALKNRDLLFRRLKYAGATLLFDRGEIVEHGGEHIALTGVIDPHFDRFRSGKVSNNMRLMMHFRDMEPVDPDLFNVLLSHRPEHLPLYAGNRFDLVFAGHAHGGQWRVPPLGGLYAPNQGILPEYTSGVYELAGTQMVVSRGLGNSVMPLRIGNPFELVLATLKSTRTQKGSARAGVAAFD